MQVDDALYLALGEVGHGDVVSQQEAQTGVVVLKIHGPAHTLGKLVNKAEHAVVGAASGIVHEIGLEFKPQILPLGFLNVHRVLRAVGPAQRDGEHGIVAVELIVQHIMHLVAVYAHKHVTHMGAAVQRTVVFNFGNGVVHGKTSES